MRSLQSEAVAEPHPRISIGGAGEKLMLRVVAEHVDGWNLIGSVDEVVRKSSVLDEQSAAVGRDPAEVKRSV